MISNLKVSPQLFQWMKEIRRTLHRYPELSFQEHKTSRYIQEKLDQLAVPYRTGFGKTGVLATLGADISSDSNKSTNRINLGHVGLRADMDALPVVETSGATYASKTEGVMHACGHDGHVAMLLGATALLKECPLEGRVTCIFQPAEEHGNGAEKIIKEGALEDGIEAVFAGHIDTHFPTGRITVDEGVICSFADPFSITLCGQSGHAARPHEARDPIVAGAYLVTAMQTLISREVDPNHSAVLTIGRFQAGRAHNIIADQAIIEGTVRSSQPDIRERVLAGVERMADTVAEQFGVITRVQFHDCLPAVINSKSATDIARYAAEKTVGRDMVISQGRPSLGGEDFSFYQQVVEGCLVRFGANSLRENSPAHSGTFDFDEEVLAIGAQWLASVALAWLKKGKDLEN